MNTSFFKEFKEIIFNKKFQNIGYLPRWIIFAIDVFIVIISCFVTHLILSSLNIKLNYFFSILTQNGFIVIINAFFFLFFRTYSGIIRHSTFIDGVKLLIATSASYFVLMVFNYTFRITSDVKLFLSTGLFLTYVITFLLLFLFRIMVKSFFERYMQEDSNKKLIKVVIYGADANAISVANALKTEKPSRFSVVAFVDKFKQDKASKSILNLPIINQTKSIHVILRSVNAEALIIAEKSLTKEEIIILVEECLEYNYKVFTVPLITDWEDQKQISNKLQNFEIDDLLHRKPIVLDTNSISNQLKNKTVLITGGAGSIGSEIVRQVVAFNPYKIIILDQAESPLHSLHLEILESKGTKKVKVKVMLADIKDYSTLEKVFNRYKPHFVFHAAAYKHVPIIEENPAQAILTNVIGTKNLADLADKYMVEKFVMVARHPPRPSQRRERRGRARAARQRGLPGGRRAGACAARGRPEHRAGRVRRLDRPVGLRQDHTAARDRRPRADQRRQRHRQRHESARRAAGARLRLCVPVAGAVPLAHGAGQRDAAAADPGPAARGLRGGRARATRPRRPGRFRAQVPVAAVGRHAAAGVDRARAGARTRAAADGRALRRAGRDHARPP